MSGETVRVGQLVGGRYRLEEPIGSGSHGEVWRAVDERLGDRAVALKRAHLGAGPGAAERLRREAANLASVNHPNVVVVHDLVAEAGDWWIAMEYVAGRTLADVGRLSPELAARYGAQLAAGLEAVHALGILHRDIKPANVLVTDQGHAKLADFGISRSVHAEPTLTGSGAITGTPGYVAPEVVRGAKFTGAADVFSLGATLFCAVEGTSPFGDDNAHALLWKTAQDERVGARRAGALAPVLDRMLQAEPKRRPRPSEVREELGEIGGVAVPGPARRLRDRRKWIWGVVALAALALVAAASPLLRTSGADEPPAADPASGGLLVDDASADPCALLDPADFEAFGATRLDSDNGNFNRCDVRIDIEGGEAGVHLYFYRTGGEPLPGEAETEGSIGVIRRDGDHEKCGRTLVLPVGDRYVQVNATQDRSGEADLCAIAETAVEGAVAVLDTGEIPRRETEPDPDSLFYVDACELPGKEGLEPLPGVDANHPAVGFAGWDCRWHSTTGDDELRLIFDRDDPPAPEDGERLTVGGRDAVVEGDHWGEGSCLVSVVHRQYPSEDGDGSTTAEYLRFQLFGDESLDELCDRALAIAEPAVTALPDSD